MTNSKVVILNSNQDSDFKAILTLSKVGKSNIRFFNLKDRFKHLALGFRQKAKVTKIPLSINNSLSSFSLNDDFDIGGGFTCAVVNVSNAFCPEIVLSASENSKAESDNIENAFMESRVEDVSTLYTDDTQEEIEDIIDDNLEHDATTTYFDACAKCKYREAFYSEGQTSCCDKALCSSDTAVVSSISKEQSLETSVHTSGRDDYSGDNNDVSTADEESVETEPNKSQEEQNDDNPTFYEQIKPQIDALFNKYDRDESLECLVPDSLWVKVTYDDNGGYYVMGVIMDNNEVKYICYGMPSKDSSTPPEDISSCAQYLPISSEDGYWVVCQDALDGRTLQVKIIE